MSPSPTWADFVLGWELGLYANPIYCAAAAGCVLGFLSVYVVLRRMVFVSAAVSQAAGLGVALAFYAAIHLGLEIEPSTAAVLASLAAAIGLAFDPRRLGLSREMLLGLVFAAAGGGAIVVGSQITQEAHDIQAILFGTAVVVTDGDLVRVLWCGGAVLALSLWWLRGTSFVSFAPSAARVQGVPVALLDGALLASIGVMVGVSARALGALPVFALCTLPGIAAVILVRGHLLATFITAAVIGAASGAGGYLLAFFLELPVGGAQTMVAALAVAVALFVRGCALVPRQAMNTYRNRRGS